MADRLYTQSQVKAVLVEQGASPDEAKVLSAVAMVEGAQNAPAGFTNMDAVGDADKETDIWGPSLSYFQIRSLKAEYGTGRLRDASRLVEQAFATRSALAIARTQGFSAWSVYNSGAYLAYYEDFTPPVGVYVVQSGDTLSEIAQEFNMEWEVIAEANGISDPRSLRIGQQLHIYLVHTVVSGDTLSGLAKKYNSNTVAIHEYNNLVNPNLIVVGQVLKIPKVW